MRFKISRLVLMPCPTRIMTSRSCSTNQEPRYVFTQSCMTKSRPKQYNTSPCNSVSMDVDNARSSLRKEMLASRFVDMIKRFDIAVNRVLCRSTGWYMQQSKMQNLFDADRQLAAISIAPGFAN